MWLNMQHLIRAVEPLILFAHRFLAKTLNFTLLPTNHMCTSACVLKYSLKKQLLALRRRKSSERAAFFTNHCYIYSTHLVQLLCAYIYTVYITDILEIWQGLHINLKPCSSEKPSRFGYLCLNAHSPLSLCSQG